MEGKSQSHEIHISSGSIVRAILFIVLFVLLYVLRDVMLIILTAVVIASALEPAAQFFARHRVPRFVGVLGIYIVIAVLVSFFVYFFLPPLLADISEVIAQMPAYLQNFNLSETPEALRFLSPGGALGDNVQTISSADVLSAFQQVLTGASGGALSLISTVFGGALSFLVIIVLSFYLTVQKDGIKHFLRVISPYKYESYIIDLWSRSQRKIGQWLQGTLTLSLVVGILVYIGLTILGVPNALFLGFIAAVFELIPLIGPIIAGVPAVIFGLINGGLQLGILVVLLYALIQQIEAQVLAPLVLQKVVGVPAIIVIISIIIGGSLAGLLGVLLSVPVAAVIMEFLSDVDARKRARHERVATASEV